MATQTTGSRIPGFYNLSLDERLAELALRRRAFS